MDHWDFNSKRRPWPFLPTALMLALAFEAPAFAEEAATLIEADAGTPARLVDVNEYVVRGNTVLDARDIEEAVYAFLGPQRSLTDIEGARDALQQRYQAKGYQSVFVELPEQQVEGGVVYLQVSETRIGRVRVVGTSTTLPSMCAKKFRR